MSEPGRPGARTSRPGGAFEGGRHGSHHGGLVGSGSLNHVPVGSQPPQVALAQGTASLTVGSGLVGSVLPEGVQDGGVHLGDVQDGGVTLGNLLPDDGRSQLGDGDAWVVGVRGSPS